MPSSKRPPYERMMLRVRVCTVTGCWLFEGALDQNGHGNVYISKGVVEKAHRVSFRHHKGDIPKGLVVRHKCDVANCVNPDHLHLGTQLMNVQDMIERGRCRYYDHRGPNGQFTTMKDLTDDQDLVVDDCPF